jgi:uncharacterized protein YggE
MITTTCLSCSSKKSRASFDCTTADPAARPVLLPRKPHSGRLAAMNKLVLLACVGLPLSLFAQGGLPDKPYIYVEGRAEIEKAADMATLRFDVVARNADQAKANQEVQTRANKIFALLNEKKIAQSDVVASDIKSEPQFEKHEEYGSKRGKIIGYIITRSFTAKVREIQIFPSLIDELLTMAGVEFSGVESGLSKDQEIRNEMFEKALIDSRKQAEKALKPVEMKIESVFAVSPVVFSQIRSRIFGSENVEATSERVIVTGSYIPASGVGNRVVSEYRLSPLTVSQSIHVIYLISPAK